MKKNLLSIIILSLLVVNIALTAVMMFSVLKTNDRTAAIVTDIADILALELDKGQDSLAPAVSLADTEVYAIPDSMTITLKRDVDDKSDRYAIVKVSISMDMTHEDYETFKDIAAKESLIKSEIISVVSSYTATEAQLSQDKMCEEILKRIQQMYNSNFIYKVSFSDIMFG